MALLGWIRSAFRPAVIPPACVHCGYPSVGLEWRLGSRCPECGVVVAATHLPGTRAFAPLAMILARWCVLPVFMLLVCVVIFAAAGSGGRRYDWVGLSFIFGQIFVVVNSLSMLMALVAFVSSWVWTPKVLRGCLVRRAITVLVVQLLLFVALIAWFVWSGLLREAMAD